MKIVTFNPRLVALGLLLALAACHKKENMMPPAKPAGNGIYILNLNHVDSLYNTPGTFLNFYDPGSRMLVGDRYSAVNGEPIGYGGIDLGIYGAKMYIVVGYASSVDIVEAKTARLIRKVSLGPQRFPSHILFYDGRAFISCNGTVAVMDTATMTISGYINAGDEAGALTIANNKLYVANSGVFNNTVSVIDLTTLTKIKEILVIPNPVCLGMDDNGNVYIQSGPDDDFVYPDPLPANYPHFGFQGGMTVIDSKQDVATSFAPSSLTAMTVQGDLVYTITGDGRIAVYNGKTQSPVSSNFITDGTSLSSTDGTGLSSRVYPQSITGNPATGEIFVTTVNWMYQFSDGANRGTQLDGSLYAFDKNGKLEYLLKTAGGDPAKIAILNN